MIGSGSSNRKNIRVTGTVGRLSEKKKTTTRGGWDGGAGGTGRGQHFEIKLDRSCFILRRICTRFVFLLVLVLVLFFPSFFLFLFLFYVVFVLLLLSFLGFWVFVLFLSLIFVSFVADFAYFTNRNPDWFENFPTSTR